MSSYTGVTNFQTWSGFYGLNYLVFSAWYRFPEFTQRIFKYYNIQNARFASDKELNILYIERLPTSSYIGVTYFQKWSVFLAHPVYRNKSRAILKHRSQYKCRVQLTRHLKKWARQTEI